MSASLLPSVNVKSASMNGNHALVLIGLCFVRIARLAATTSRKRGSPMANQCDWQAPQLRDDMLVYERCKLEMGHSGSHEPHKRLGTLPKIHEYELGPWERIKGEPHGK